MRKYINYIKEDEFLEAMKPVNTTCNISGLLITDKEGKKVLKLTIEYDKINSLLYDLCIFLRENGLA